MCRQNFFSGRFADNNRMMCRQELFSFAIYCNNIYIFIRHERQQQKIKQQKRDRQTDRQRQTSKQSTDYISQIRLLVLVNKLTHTLWKHFQQIRCTSNFTFLVWIWSIMDGTPNIVRHSPTAADDLEQKIFISTRFIAKDIELRSRDSMGKPQYSTATLANIWMTTDLKQRSQLRVYRLFQRYYWKLYKI